MHFTGTSFLQVHLLTQELHKANKQLEVSNANCAKLSAECARLSRLNQVTVCTVMYAMIMFAHLLVQNVYILLVGAPPRR